MLAEPMAQPMRAHKIIAHRGLSSIFPENTKEAVIAALHCSDFAEIDVHLTRDNQVVVFHDRTLGRVTDVRMRPEFFGLRK